jgi:hypothetical protein
MTYQTTQTLPNDVDYMAATHHLGPFSQAYLVAARSPQATVFRFRGSSR